MTNINTFQGDVFIHEYIKHTGDDNNLFGFSGTDTFKIATAGVDRLTVASNGTATFGAALEIPDYIYHTGDGDNLFGFSGTDTFKIATAGSDRLTVGSDGTVTLGVNMAIPDYIYHTGDTNTYFGFSGADTIVMRTAGSDRLTVQSNGNVGIGTATSDNRVHIYNNVDNVGYVMENNARTYTMGIRGDTSDVFAITDDTAGAFRMTVTTAGVVKFFGDVYFNQNFGLGAVSGSYGSVETKGTGAGSYEGYNINGQWVFMSNGAGSCGIYNDTNNEWMTQWIQNSSTDLYYNGSNKFQTTNDGAHVSGNLYMNNIYVDQYIYHTGDNNTYQMFNSDNIRMYVGGTHTLDTNASMTSIYNSNFRNYKTNAHPYLYCQAATAGYDPHLFIKSTGAEWAMWNNGVNTDFNFYCSNGNRNTVRIACSGNNSYLNFTGQHRAFVDGVPYKNVNTYEGQIVSANNERYIGMNDGIKCGLNAITVNESLPVVSISNVVNDKTCFGVISTGEDDNERGDTYGTLTALFPKEDGDTRIYINSIGEGAIWVTDLNGNIEAGDYITTSNIAGYGQKQDDDILHNYTVAKATMSCDFNPPQQPVKQIAKTWSTKTWWELPGQFLEASDQQYDETIDANRRIDEEINEAGETVYIKKFRTIQESNTRQEDWNEVSREQWVNTLDSDNLITFEENGEIEAAYKIRYLAANGQITDEDNHVHKAAFVGCTYHCG